MKPIGKILWTDLTVKNAANVKDFYCKVIGWTAEPVPVNDHEDYIIKASGDTIAGICNQSEKLKNLPNQWLNYFGVDDLEESIKTCNENGGKVIDGPMEMGGSRLAVIQDPQGAFFAITQVK